jgi:hypothetical protein
MMVCEIPPECAASSCGEAQQRLLRRKRQIIGEVFPILLVSSGVS